MPESPPSGAYTNISPFISLVRLSPLALHLHAQGVDVSRGASGDEQG